MSLRRSARVEVSRDKYKVAVDAEEGRRRREDNIVEIRKSKREESLQKKRCEGMPGQSFLTSVQGSAVDKKALKRPKTPDHAEKIKRQRKKYDGDDKIQDISAATSDSDISSKEDDTSVQMHVYDNLLRALGSRNDEIDCLYGGRLKHQAGIGHSNGGDDADSSFASASEEEVGERGSDSKLNFKDNDDQIEPVSNYSTREGSGEESEDDEEAADNDVHDFGSDSHVLADETENTSSFQHHFGHSLANEEVDKLMKQKFKFKWEMPAHGLLMSKIVGTGQDLSMDLDGKLFHGINKKLYNHWQSIYNSCNSDDSCSSKRNFFFSLCNVYRDLMHCNKKPFYLKGQEEDSSIMDAYIMHALNHVYRTLDLVRKNDAKLNNHENSIKEDIFQGESYLDQGFTRPKVLILLPLASIAFRVVKRLVQLTPLSHKGNVAHMDRFSEEFGTEQAEEDENIDGSSKSQKTAKPADFQILFGRNNNDHFMIGIKFTKRSIKLYSNFYSSDIIIASPLGLITKIGEAEVDTDKDVDYLSSIEVLIIDHADVITMQNWSHVNTVVEQLNHMPSKQHGTDVMRIKKCYLEGHARFYRQTILLGSSLTPDMNALLNRLCFNYEGKLKLLSKYKGVLHQVILQVRQVYERFVPSSIVDADDTRLEHFCKKIFPQIKDSLEGGTMLFISSYFEFVRIRNFLKSQNASFCLLGEYTKQSDISRARLWFFEGKRKIMLYTERAHFYHRYKIRGIKKLIIYSLPERKEFYPEIVNMLEGSNPCSVLFSRFDHYRLERIVGTAAAKRMISSDKGIFVFC